MTGTAYAWTVYGTMLALLLAVISLMANLSLRTEARLEAKIDAFARDLRAEMREGFAQVDNRLRLLERDRS